MILHGVISKMIQNQFRRSRLMIGAATCGRRSVSFGFLISSSQIPCKNILMIPTYPWDKCDVEGWCQGRARIWTVCLRWFHTQRCYPGTIVWVLHPCQTGWISAEVRWLKNGKFRSIFFFHYWMSHFHCWELTAFSNFLSSSINNSRLLLRWA